MAIMGVLLLGALITAYEAPPLYRGKHYKDLIVFAVFIVLGLTLNILLILNVPIISPTTVIKDASGFLLKIFAKIGGIFTP